MPNDEFVYTPKPQNPTAHRLVYSLWIVAAGLAVLSLMLPVYKGAVMLGAMAVICVSLLLYNRYLAGEYIYCVEIGADGVARFTVLQRIGKRMSTLYAADLHLLISAKAETDKERRAGKAQKGTRRYLYFATFCPKESILAVFEDGGQRDEVHLEMPTDLADRLLSLADRARQDRTFS